MTENFKEKLEQYRSGNLNYDDSEKVKCEIEKHLAIMDFLDEDSKIELSTENILATSPQINSFKRKLNFRYVRIPLLTIIALMIFSVIFYYASGNIISKCYPDLTDFQNKMGSIDLELNIYFSNFLPETYRLSSNGHEKELFAQYSAHLNYVKELGHTKLDELQIGINYSLGKPASIKNSYLNKGNLRSAVAWENDFYLTNPKQEYGFKYRDKKGFDTLESLPEGIQAEVWIAFNKTVPISKVDEILNTNNFNYYAEFTAIDTGFTPPQHVDGLDGSKFNEKLVFGCNMQSLIDISNIDGTKGYADKPTQDWYNKNYISLLTHMQKRQNDIKVVFEDSAELTGFNLDLANRVEYIKKNGVNCIGVVVYGNAKEILKLKGNSLICGSDVKNVAVW